MNTVIPERAHRRPEKVLSAATATRHQRVAGIALMLISSASNQGGAAVGSLAFPAIGPTGVVAVRQIIAALVLVSLIRPRFRGLRRRQWAVVLGLAAVYCVMNISLYSAVERIGLGLAVTLEFLGPLAVAVATSRRVIDVACAVLAGVGVIVLVNPSPSTDLPGLLFALVAATAWAAYILLNRAAGQSLPGMTGAALASTLAAGVWVPIATVWFLYHPPSLDAISLAVLCGVLSSVIPYIADIQSLRRVSAATFGTFTSINPLWAMLFGSTILHEILSLNEWVGVFIIIVANALVSVGGLIATRNPKRRSHLERKK